MCLRRAPEKYIAGAKAPAGAALDRAGLDNRLLRSPRSIPHKHFLVLNSVTG
jgi:hypothetical protein